jgi:hypothetical protein
MGPRRFRDTVGVAVATVTVGVGVIVSLAAFASTAVKKPCILVMHPPPKTSTCRRATFTTCMP